MQRAAAQSRMGRLLRARVAGQEGLVTRAQLLEAGWSPEAVRWQVTSGRWARPHRGVYLTTPGRDDWGMHAVAALLAVGPPSCLCGTSAGQAWGLVTAPTGSGQERPDLEVLVPVGRNGASLPGVSVRRTRRFSTMVHPTQWPHRTTAEHTVLDLSVGHGPDRGIALMAKACQLRLTTEPDLAAVLRGRASHPHGRVLAEALGVIGEGAESAAEVRYIRDVEQAHGLPRGCRQQPAPGQRRRDTAYEQFDVLVEIDGRLGHVGWNNQQRDVRRDRKAAAHGRITVRASWTDLVSSPCELAADISAILRQRGWDGARPCGRPGCDVSGPLA